MSYAFVPFLISLLTAFVLAFVFTMVVKIPDVAEGQEEAEDVNSIIMNTEKAGINFNFHFSCLFYTRLKYFITLF